MERNKGHPMAALDPAERGNMMALLTRDPNIVTPPMNPAPGVTHGPVPPGWLWSKSCIHHSPHACNRIFNYPVAKRRRKAREVHLIRCKRTGRAWRYHLSLAQSRDLVKGGSYQMRALSKGPGGRRHCLRNVAG